MLRVSVILLALATVGATAFAGNVPPMMAETPAPETQDSSPLFFASQTSMHGWYVGLGANYNATFKSSSPNSEELGHTTPGGNLFGGYQLNSYFGAQLGFSYIGNTGYTGLGPNSGRGDRTRNNYNVSLVGNAFAPVSDWFQPYAFAGVAYMNTKLSCSSGGCLSGDETLGPSRHYSGVGLLYGAGLQFNIRPVSIRFSYAAEVPGSNEALANDSFTNNTELPSYINLDVLYRFGGKTDQLVGPLMGTERSILRPWYVGAGLNYGVVFNDDVTNGSKLQNNRLGGNVFFGYRANRYFGTQVEFSRLGNISYHNQQGDQKTTTLYANQMNFSVVGNVFLPILSWLEPYAFIGPAYMSVDFSNASFSGVGLLYGGGLQFNIKSIAAIRLNYAQQSSPNNRVLGGSGWTWNNRTTGYINLDALYRF